MGSPLRMGEGGPSHIAALEFRGEKVRCVERPSELLSQRQQTPMMPLGDEPAGPALLFGRLPFRDARSMGTEVPRHLSWAAEGFDDARCWFHASRCSDYRNAYQGWVVKMATAQLSGFSYYPTQLGTELMIERWDLWVASALEASGMSQAALADAVARITRTPMDRSKINKIVLGKRDVSASEMLAIAQITGVEIPDYVRAPAPTIAVAGKVGAGAKVPLTDPYSKGDGIYQVECPPQLSPHGVVAVEVEGDSMAPMYQPGHVLFFSRNSHEGVLAEDVGFPCIVECEDGNAWVKLVKRGDEPGLFHLISLNPTAETMHNQRIKWAARVKLALPAEFVVRS